MRKKDQKKLRDRVISVVIAIIFMFTFDAGRVLYLQVVRGDELSAKAKSQQISDEEIPSVRGTIYDSTGNVLAQSATVYNIFIDPSNIDSEKKRDLVVNGISKILSFSVEEKEELIKKTKQTNKYAIVAKKIENDLKDEIIEYSKSNKLTNIIGTEKTTKRYYPYGSLASTVLGFTGEDGDGLSGVESSYNEELTGKNGRKITVKDANDNDLTDENEMYTPAEDGQSITLTINESIQYYLEKDLRETLNKYKCKGTYGVVMDCNTGAVLAMASMPDYDCNDPYKLTYSKDIKAVSKAKGKEKTKIQSEAIQNQWRNFTVSDTYTPGSVFKTFTSCMALEENIIDLDYSYTCTGAIKVANYTMKCHYHAGHGKQNFTQGLENSCNPFFITVGQKLGVKNYYKYYDGFGFTQKTGIDLPGEAISQYYKEEQYGIAELSSAAFGQTNSETPIQICTALCAVANGGTLLKPYIVSNIKDAEGNTVAQTEKTVVRQVISEDTSEKVRKMMKSVVDNGTGKNGYVAGYRVGGKTGTSTKLEVSTEKNKKYLVSFAAIAPVDDPQIAMIILCDEPKADLGGGAVCAPIAANVIEHAMSVLNVEPQYGDKESEHVSIKVPSLIKKSVKDAKSTIKNSNLNSIVIGSGDKVVSQSPASGTQLQNDGIIYIYTDDTKVKTYKVPDFTGMTVSEAKAVSKRNNININIKGNTQNVIAYKQSVQKGKSVDAGTVVTVSFKNTASILD